MLQFIQLIFCYEFLFILFYGKKYILLSDKSSSEKKSISSYGKKIVKKIKVQKQAISHIFILITYYIGVFYEESKFF